MDPPQLPGELIWLVEEGFFGYVGTSSQDGEPHVTPVIFVFDGRDIYFLTSKTAKKLRNMKENPKVAFLIDVRDPSELLNNRAVMIMGRVKIYGILDALLRLRHLLRIRRLFFKKYPKYMKSYRTEDDKIPKRWKTTLFIHRILLRLNIEKFVYMREARQAHLGRRDRR